MAEKWKVAGTIGGFLLGGYIAYLCISPKIFQNDHQELVSNLNRLAEVVNMRVGPAVERSTHRKLPNLDQKTYFEDKLPPVEDKLQKPTFSQEWKEDPRLTDLRLYGVVENIPDDETLDKYDKVKLSAIYHSFLDNSDIRCYRKLRMGLVGNCGWECQERTVAETRSTERLTGSVECMETELWRRGRKESSHPAVCLMYSLSCLSLLDSNCHYGFILVVNGLTFRSVVKTSGACFSINYDFSFDDDSGRIYGCDVYSFDPSMSKQPTYRRSDRVMFYRLGIGSTSGPVKKLPSGWVLHSLSNFRQMLSHTHTIIDVLKMDVEDAEWSSMQTMIKERQLESVRQLLVEYHMTADNATVLRRNLKVIRDVERIGFRKFYITKNPRCKRKAIGIPIDRVSCYEVHYVNMNLVRKA